MEIQMLTKRALKLILYIEQEPGVKDPWSAQKIEDFLKRENTVGIYVSSGIIPVGYALFEIEGKSVNVIRLIVSKEFRKKGFGTALYNRIVNNIESFCDNVTKYNFIISEDDGDSIQFYLKKGLQSKLKRKFFNENTDAIAFYLER